ncbi:MAG TPA: hypothetical protein PKW05_05520 [Anaerolineae bacterium]|nr:hypothetical protein [Anaerolineae bacterium]
MAGFCGNCGKPQREGERFCRYCGTPFATVQQASAPPVLEQPQPEAPVAPLPPAPAPAAEAAPAASLEFGAPIESPVETPPAGTDEPLARPAPDVWAQPMPVPSLAAAVPPLTEAPQAKKAKGKAQAKPAQGEGRRRTSPLAVGLLVLAALGACVAGVWFGGKALLGRLGPGKYLRPTATAESGQVLTIASARQVIGPEGGTLALDTGVRLVIPAGAVSGQTEVVVKQLDAARFADETREAVLLDCTAGVATFDKPVEIHVPLPDWFTPEMADAAQSGVWNSETDALEVEPSTVQMVDGKPVLVVQASHFSWRVVEWFKQNYALPPNEADTLEVPYYSQSGGYCWAATLQMLNESAKHSLTSEEFNIIGMVGVDDTGLGARAARHYPSIRALVRSETNKEPERMLWSVGTYPGMLTYIRRQIACFRRPVGLMYEKHAVLVVGYDGTKFTVLDPQGLKGDIYKVTTLLGLGMTEGEEKTTIVVPAPLAADRPLVTVNIKDKALTFVKPATATPGDQFEFRWDYTVARGYSWYSLRQSAVVAVIPAEVSELKIAVGGDNGVEIANSHLKAAVDVTVRVDIYSHGPGKTHFSDAATMSLAPGEFKPLKVKGIAVSAFRDPSPGQVDYTLEIRTVVGGKTVDEARVDFVLEPGATPTPTSTAKTVPTETGKPEPGATPGPGEWVLQAIVPYGKAREDSQCYFNNRMSLGDGSFVSSGSWTDAGGCVSGSSASGSIHCTCTWGAPPSYLKVGSTLSMEMTCHSEAEQTAGYKNSGAQGWIWYTLNPPPADLKASTYGSRKILGDVLATGPSNQYPKTASKSGSVTVPGGSDGDVLAIVVHAAGQGGGGELVYKYAYHGKDPVPPRGVPAEGLTPQAPVPTITPTVVPSATPTQTPEPTATPTAEEPEPEPQVTPTEEYGVGEREIWAVDSIYLVYNGAGVPTKFMITRHWLITRIINYHWNDGKGAEPGWIALRADSGTLYGPWWAVGQEGYGGVRNAYWLVKPDTVIPAGIYTVIDSDPLTWAQNEETGGRGISRGYGIAKE